MEMTTDKDARTMAMLSHLLGLVPSVGWLGPLVILLIKGKEHPFIDDQAKESLNFQITLFIGWVISGVLAAFCIGAVLGMVLAVVSIVLCIMGAVKASDGVAYRYPFAIRLVK